MRAVPRSLIVGVVLAWAATAVVGRCEGSPPREEDTVTSWDSPKVLKVKKEWIALWEMYVKTPKKLPGRHPYDTVTEMQEKLLRNSLSDADMRNLAATCGSLPIRFRDWGEFERATMEFAVDVFLYSGDRGSLVRLFSTRFPLRVGTFTIEEYLASFGRGRLADPILVLAEAYSRSRIPETRAYIAAAMRRAFGGVGRQGISDADFVKDSVEWYRKEENRLVFNTGHYYWDPSCVPLEPDERSPGSYERAWRDQAPLFVVKNGRGSPRARTASTRGCRVAQES
jgi:hypothetical protein